MVPHAKLYCFPSDLPKNGDIEFCEALCLRQSKRCCIGILILVIAETALRFCGITGLITN